MEQNTTKNGIVTLTASEGMVLKNGETYSTKVWLGVNDSPDNWTEVPYSEYEDWMKEQEKIMEEENESNGPRH